MNRHNLGAPLVAVVLLLIPVVYIASYIALVTPPHIVIVDGTPLIDPFQGDYHFGDKLSERLFWPIQQLDRKIRPNVWRLPNPEDPYDFGNFEDPFGYESADSVDHDPRDPFGPPRGHSMTDDPNAPFR